MTTLTTIGFDADDTLWENLRFYEATEAHLLELLSPYAEGADIAARLLEAERKNLAFYGYGIKGFTLSMIDTAISLTNGTVPGEVIASILAAGREMLVHPIETLPFVRETLDDLAGKYRLVLITKGDLFDQERKVAQSGLGEYFNAVEIVSEKSTTTYARLFAEHGRGPEHAMMVGNSLKSDVVPAIEAGSWGVHVPHQLTWELDHADAPSASVRFHEIKHLGHLPGLIDEIKQRLATQD
jgi:putative hydrolase of the HAD superfamily